LRKEPELSRGDRTSSVLLQEQGLTLRLAAEKNARFQQGAAFVSARRLFLPVGQVVSISRRIGIVTPPTGDNLPRLVQDTLGRDSLSKGRFAAALVCVAGRYSNILNDTTTSMLSYARG
jgi:hypothetical protein